MHLIIWSAYSVYIIYKLLTGNTSRIYIAYGTKLYSICLYLSSYFHARIRENTLYVRFAKNERFTKENYFNKNTTRSIDWSLALLRCVLRMDVWVMCIWCVIVTLKNRRSLFPRLRVRRLRREITHILCYVLCESGAF